MPKEQYREADVARKINEITFGVESSESIQQQAHIQIVSSKLYDGQRAPIPYGALDRRLGTNSKDALCLTCGKNLQDCFGHFGYIDLELPVFSLGYFRSIINILQTICKSCSKVMLSEDDAFSLRNKLRNPDLNYLTKKILRKKIIDKCKKVKICMHCKALNGIVKKLPSSKTSATGSLLKIVHEKYRGKKESDPIVQEHLMELSSAIDISIAELAMMVGPLIEVLTPIDVLQIFKKIPMCDISLLAMNFKRGQPKDLIMTRVPVPPVCIRPSVKSDLKEGTNEDDLTMHHTQICFINDCIKNYKKTGVNVPMYQDAWDFLQLHTALYINSELSGVPTKMMNLKPGRGLVQRLKGKQGRFRGNLSGKRVDFSSRTVISPDPNLEIDQVGVPCHIAKILTYPERVFKGNMELMRQLVLNGPDIWPGANYIERRGFRRYLKYGNRVQMAQDLKLGDIVERHLHDGDIVLFNRQPSLHKLSILAHKAKIHKLRTFRFNECCCNPFNADFDGDEMNLHLPQTEESKAEARILLSNKSNLVTPRNGELLIALIQDFLTGGYALTSKDIFFDSFEANQFAAVLCAASDTQIKLELPPPAILKPKRLWTGKQIASLVFKPNNQSPARANLETKGKSYTKNRELCVNDSYVVVRNSELLAGCFDKGHLGSGGKTNNIFYVMLRDFGEDLASRCMWRLARQTYLFLMLNGFSIGIGDVRAGENLLKQVQGLLSDGYNKCDDYINAMEIGQLPTEVGCTVEESFEAVVLKALSEVREHVGAACIADLHSTNAPLIMALSGSKGSVINISQMVGCVGQQALNGKRVPDGFHDKSIPHYADLAKIPAAKGFVKNSYYSGLTPTEFYFHTMAGREGLVDTAVKTADTGYMQRRLVKSLEDLVVQYDSTVRNADGHVVQIVFGCDGLDPTYMEGNGCPVDFNRVLRHVQAENLYRDETVLDANQIRRATQAFLQRNTLDATSQNFKTQLVAFMEQIARKVETTSARYGKAPVVKEIERLTCSQLVAFMETCGQKYIKSIIEPGTAVGALAAQSIGEPGTQMTLKTFHFAGVASMNITQGVPRIKEIINASRTISTPIITSPLTDPYNQKAALKVKDRIERTTIGQVCSGVYVHITKSRNFVHIALDKHSISFSRINADAVKTCLLCAPKLKIKPNEVAIHSAVDITVTPTKETNFVQLKEGIMNLTLRGYPTVNRVVIAENIRDGKPFYNICVEGDNLRDVMATYGVDGKKAKSNNIMEVYQTLGIEAARQTIINEITFVMENHSMSVDYRHIMLLAAQMTHTGEVLGITRQGLAKMKQSVLNLASFEKTADHLFDAAYYGQTDKINGVSESIIMGMPPPIGTGLIKLLHVHDVDKNPAQLPLLFEAALLDAKES